MRWAGEVWFNYEATGTDEIIGTFRCEADDDEEARGILVQKARNAHPKFDLVGGIMRVISIWEDEDEAIIAEAEADAPEDIDDIRPSDRFVD